MELVAGRKFGYLIFGTWGLAMANRPTIYDEEQGRTFDILWGWRDAMIALGQMEQDITGNTTGHMAGFAGSPTGPATLTINLAAGRIYQQSAVDTTAWGALASDSDIIQQQGAAAAQQVTLSTAALSAGQSQWALIECQFAQVDEVAPGDPTGGLLFYFNSANPSQPFQGPGNSGQIQNTTRLGSVSIRVVLGAPATTGSEVPPQPDTGWLPMYLIDLTFGQTQITSGQILIAGPSAGLNVPSNYPGAPFVAGLLNQHHTGVAGQAPKIDLTSEVQHLLPLANSTASSTSGGGLPVMKLNAGNPNGNVAGNASVNGASDLCFDTINLILYICTTTGTTSTAVWTSVVGSSTSQFAGGSTTGTANAQVVATTTPAGFAKTPGQVVTATVGTGLTNTGSATLNVDATGASTINKNTGGGNVPLTGGELVAGAFVSFIWTGTVYLLQSQSLGQLATLNIGTWLKNDGSGNLTIKNSSVMGDDGSGNFTVLPQYLPPIGCIIGFGGNTVPSGGNWVLCNGQAVSRTLAAFSVVGINFGSGDGVTTWNVPDLRGRAPVGVDGGVGRLTTATMSSQSMGGVGGLETRLLTTAMFPAYTPSGSVSSSATSTTTGTIAVQGFAQTGVQVIGAVSFGSNNGGLNQESYLTLATSTTVTSSFSGNGQGGSNSALPVVQPSLEVNYLMRLF